MQFLWFLGKFIKKLPDENLNAIEKLEVPNEHSEIAKWLLNKQLTQDSESRIDNTEEIPDQTV